MGLVHGFVEGQRTDRAGAIPAALADRQRPSQWATWSWPNAANLITTVPSTSETRSITTVRQVTMTTTGRPADAPHEAAG
ncbi:hypothetical protein [Actinokineospora cianjurensis]|uniref:Uncharacterized protein n=1 Tax=Actinokineospora cianjurensis TaxID=585224 RepID=A0A421B2P3_9PSEU|nr:hypothetical protein [Actinokineospora cianjurensis]RLK58696.1 hypothetical protein CLV68_3169 [Actinokineospora cianjurensis]